MYGLQVKDFTLVIWQPFDSEEGPLGAPSIDAERK